MMRLMIALALLPALLLPSGRAGAADPANEVTLTLRGHQFDPASVTVPAGQKVTLVIRNEDATPEEFESHDLKAEKVVAAGKTIRITVGPLKPGEYRFVGEYHEDTAKGVLTAR